MVLRPIRSVLRLQDTPWRWSIGVEAALAIAIPGSLLTLAGYPAQARITSLGAFTVLHFASAPRPQRMRILPFPALGLILASIVGVLSAPSAALTILTLVLTTGAASLLMSGFSAGPPGALMFTLVAGVSGYIDRRTGAAASIPLLVALGSLCAYLVVIAPLLIPSCVQAIPDSQPLPRWRLDPAAPRAAGRLALAAAIAAVIGSLLEIQRIYWVVSAAVAVLQTHPARRIVTLRAVHRVLGSFLGVGLFAVLVRMHLTGLPLIAALAVLQGTAEVVVVRNYGLALLFITPVALLIAAAGNPAGSELVVKDRLADTLLGAAIALIIFLLSEHFTAPRTQQPDGPRRP